MIIYKDEQFIKSLDSILDYIAKDGLDYAISFNRKLKKSYRNYPPLSVQS